MSRKYCYVVQTESNPALSGVFENRDEAVKFFRRMISWTFEDEVDGHDIDYVSEEDLKGDYFESDGFRSAIEAVQEYETAEYHSFSDEIAWTYTYTYPDGLGNKTGGCMFSYYCADMNGFRRKWMISLVCLPVFETDEEQENSFRNDEVSKDEFINSQFKGKNGKPWNPFVND